MKIINSSVFKDLVSKATASERRRSNYNLHETSQDLIQRYLVGSKLDSYFRPHRHRARIELALILRGCFDVLLFSDQAVVTQRISFGPDCGNTGFELPPDIWHTWLPMIDDSIFFEVKQGPYDPAVSIDFAPWSPPEGDPGVSAFLANLRRLRPGDPIA
jgi:cupin fold WbuC family metalloprotein